MKKMKNHEENEKMKKMMKITKLKKNLKKFGFRRKMPNDFQGLPLLLLYFFYEILGNFHVCVRNVSLSL